MAFLSIFASTGYWIQFLMCKMRNVRKNLVLSRLADLVSTIGGTLYSSNWYQYIKVWKHNSGVLNLESKDYSIFFVGILFLRLS